MNDITMEDSYRELISVLIYSSRLTTDEYCKIADLILVLEQEHDTCPKTGDTSSDQRDSKS